MVVVTKLASHNLSIFPHVLRPFSWKCERVLRTLADFLHSSDTGKKWEYNGTVQQLFIDFKKAYESVRREVLHNFPIEFGIQMKLVGLIKICLNETYNKVRIGR
jgi:hypothetical protein